MKKFKIKNFESMILRIENYVGCKKYCEKFSYCISEHRARTYLSKDYAIVPDGAGWCMSVYIYGDLRLHKSYLNGELYNAALEHDKDAVF